MLALTCSSEYLFSTILRLLYLVICRTVIFRDLTHVIATLVIGVVIESSIYIMTRSQSELFLLQRWTENAEKQMQGVLNMLPTAVIILTKDEASKCLFKNEISKTMFALGQHNPMPNDVD